MTAFFRPIGVRSRARKRIFPQSNEAAEDRQTVTCPSCPCPLIPPKHSEPLRGIVGHQKTKNDPRPNRKAQRILPALWLQEHLEVLLCTARRGSAPCVRRPLRI